MNRGMVMHKKILCMGLLTICGSMLMGCNSVIELTNDESRLISEYAVDLLLKYDTNFTDRIAEGEQEEEQMSEEEQTVSETVTTQKKEEVNTTQGEITTEETIVGSQEDIAKIAGISDVSIRYTDYQITSQYPTKSEDGTFISLEAEKGYQLLVVRFNIKNKTKKATELSLLDKDLEYRVICNGDKAANPMLTILMEDLGTFATTLNPKEEQEAVLIFQISDDMKDKLESIDLRVNYDNTENKIMILE